MINKLTVLTLAAIGISGMAATATVEAHTYRYQYASSTNSCQPATPLELGGLRFRPLGIFNNKPVGIYISCSLDTEFPGDQASTDLQVWFTNSTADPVEVSCTAQGGSRLKGVNNYPGSVVVQPGATSPLTFNNIDKVSTDLTHINLSCLLPGGVEMGTIRLQEESIDNLL